VGDGLPHRRGLDRVGSGNDHLHRRDHAAGHLDVEQCHCDDLRRGYDDDCGHRPDGRSLPLDFVVGHEHHHVASGIA
jgi:hypothetical protein